MLVAASIPTKTGVLTLLRAVSEAPLAHTSGTSPRMKAIDVIITARNRERDQHHQSDLGIKIERQLGNQDARDRA